MKNQWLWTCLLMLSPILVAGNSVDDVARSSVTIPNVPVLDQDGRELHFFDDLVKDKVVAVNFIFTTCPSICPPMGANFAALQKQLSASNSEVSLISVSINPVTDTPARLKAWRARFGGGPGWNLVTGNKRDIDQLLKVLEVFSADISAHAPFVLLGDGRGGAWRYLNGLTPPKQLAGLLTKMETEKHSAAHDGGHTKTQPKSASAAGPQEGAARYFANLNLTDQNGQERDLYKDIMHGKVIIMNSFFTSCKSVCPVTMGNMGHIQEWLGQRLGRDVVLLSISVDPLTDTPARLKTYAQDLKARPGWYLLTGDREQVNAALNKFGQLVDDRDSHSNVFIIGKETTGLWKKAFGLSKPEALLDVVRSVLEDNG